MTTIFSRSTLKRAFPDDPRAVSEFEKLDRMLSAVDSNGQTVADKLAALVIPDASTLQPASALLDAVAGVPDDNLGVLEKTDLDQVTLRQVDSDDDACLVSRLNLMSYVGKGATADRPTLSTHHRAIYFDTDLAANGKPIFWTGAAWVDYTGTVV